MLYIYFIFLTSSVQYCITTNISNSCDCHNYTEVYDDEFSDDLIFNQSTVDLYFCTIFDKAINITQINQQYIINSANKISLSLNFAQIKNTISLSFQNVNILVQNWNSKTLTVNSFYILQSSFRLPNNEKFILIPQRFSGDYEGYLEFDSIQTNNLGLLRYNLLNYPSNPSINLSKINSDPQQIDIEIMNDCYIQFQNYSVIFTNNFSLTINVKTRAKINLYVTGTHYIFFSYYPIYGSNFIPVNIYNAITIPDRILLRLNYTGLFGSSIPSENFMTVGQFPSTITVDAHIQNKNIPLTLHLYQNTRLIIDVINSSILGSIVGCYPNTQILSNITEQAYFQADSIERLAGTVGSVQCSPKIHLTLNRFTDHNFISGQRGTIYFRNLDRNPGLNFHTNLEENSNIYTNIGMSNSGIYINTIEGSFTFPPGEKHLHVSFDSSIRDDIYFYRYFKYNTIPLLCNKLEFDYNEWSVDFSIKTNNKEEILPFQFNQQYSINSLKSLKCLSIQFQQLNEIKDMNQGIYIGNNVINRSFDSLVADETENLSSIIDNSVNFFKIKIGVATTIDLKLFKDYSTIIISGVDNRNSFLNLIISDNTRNIPLHILVIDTCMVNLTGDYIQADKIVIHNCQFTNFTIDLNTNFLCVPLSLYSYEKISTKKFSSLTIFNIDNVAFNFTQNSVIINEFEILNDNFDNLWVYPLSASTRAVNYNLFQSGVPVKGVSLNFSGYDVDGYYYIGKPVPSLSVSFGFTGNWSTVPSLINPFMFDLSGLTTTLPQSPTILGSNFEFDSGSIVFNAGQTGTFQNPISLNQNLFIDSAVSNFTFSNLNIERTLSMSSRKIVTIDTLRIENDASVSLNPITSRITTLNMGVGSQLNTQVDLEVNTATLNFSLEKVPTITATRLPSITQLNLNFVNDTDSKPSNFIGVQRNILCAPNLNCSIVQPTIRYNSAVGGISSDQIGSIYQTDCTDPDRSNNVCLYLYLDNDTNLIINTVPKSKKKVKPWIIAIAIIIPLIILLIIFIIFIVIKVRRSKKAQGSSEENSSKEKESSAEAQTPKRRKIQAPIPPRKAVRWDPRRRRYAYDEDNVFDSQNQSNDEDEDDDEDKENNNDKGLSKTVIEGFLNDSEESHSQLSPTQSPKRKSHSSRDPEKNAHKSE